MTHTSRPAPGRTATLLALGLWAAASSACQPAAPPPAQAPAATAPAAPAGAADDLVAKAARFAPADIGADLTALPEHERTALRHLVSAARVIDGLFLRQVWAGSPSMLLQLQGDPTPVGQARLRYFILNKGPWSRLDGNAPFIEGVGDKPGGANYYPAGATKEEVEQWMASLPAAAKAQAQGLLHHHPARDRRALHGRAVRRRVPG